MFGKRNVSVELLFHYPELPSQELKFQSNFGNSPSFFFLRTSLCNDQRLLEKSNYLWIVGNQMFFRRCGKRLNEQLLSLSDG